MKSAKEHVLPMINDGDCRVLDSLNNIMQTRDSAAVMASEKLQEKEKSSRGSSS